jgi:hypothetical protein
MAFHPECPLCTGERLAGVFPRDGVMSQRTQAVLAASVLALSTASPAVALAQEPDQQHEGVASPDQPTEPAFDPGAGSTQLPLARADDTAATEPEPAADAIAPTVDAGDGSGAQPPAPATGQSKSPAPLGSKPVVPSAQQTDRPATSPAKPVDEGRQPGRPAPTQDDGNSPVDERGLPVLPTPIAKADDEPEDDAHPDEPREAVLPIDTAPADKPKSGADRNERAPVETLSLTTPGPRPDAEVPQPEPETAATDSPAPQPQPAITAPAPSTSPSTAIETASASHAPRRGDRFHVVRPSESLWSIAAALLPADASTARIAREVNRLWELNSSRIATGDPDLLAIGTKLVLR